MRSEDAEKPRKVRERDIHDTRGMKNSTFWRNNNRDSRDTISYFLGYLLLPWLNRHSNKICAHIQSFSSPFVAFLCPPPPPNSLSDSLPESPFLRLSFPHVLPLHGGQKCSATAVFPPRMLLPLTRGGESTRQLSPSRAPPHSGRHPARAGPSRAVRPCQAGHAAGNMRRPDSL